MLKIKIKKLPHANDLPLPKHMTDHSAGADLIAAVEKEEIIKPGEYKLIPTGISIEIPQGFEGSVRPRSGLALKYGVTLLNTPGTIDADYRGEVSVIMINHGQKDFVVVRGERIAQLVISKYEKVEFDESKELGDTQRSSGGFGHTGR